MEMSDDLLSLFGMDPLRDIDKDSSTQMIIEDVDTKRNLAQREMKQPQNQRGGYRKETDPTLQNHHPNRKCRATC
jgi:hypothetical protein